MRAPMNSLKNGRPFPADNRSLPVLALPPGRGSHVQSLANDSGPSIARGQTGAAQTLGRIAKTSSR